MKLQHDLVKVIGLLFWASTSSALAADVREVEVVEVPKLRLLQLFTSKPTTKKPATSPPTPRLTSSPTRKITRGPTVAPTPAPRTRFPTTSPTTRLPFYTSLPTRAPKAPTRTPTTNPPVPTAAPVPATRSPTFKYSVAPTRPKTQPPVAPQCVVANKTLYNCGDPISIAFNYSELMILENPLIDDLIGIFPNYVKNFTIPEIWQWTCGAPPATPSSCSQPRAYGIILFDSLPSYNEVGRQDWPVSANYNQLAKEVNRYFKAVLLRQNGTALCSSSKFQIIENSKPGCKIRQSSPSG